MGGSVADSFTLDSKYCTACGFSLRLRIDFSDDSSSLFSVEDFLAVRAVVPIFKLG